MTKRRFRAMAKEVTRRSIVGCSNHGCRFVDDDSGMRTNSICKCHQDIARDLWGMLAALDVHGFRFEFEEDAKDGDKDDS